MAENTRSQNQKTQGDEFNTFWREMEKTMERKMEKWMMGLSKDLQSATNKLCLVDQLSIQVEDLQQQVEHLSNKQLDSKNNEVNQEPPIRNHESENLDPRGDSMKGTDFKNMKLYFPTFDGINCREWLYKSEIYFKHFDVNDKDKLTIVSMNVEGKALIWYQEWIKSVKNPTWEGLLTVVHQDTYFSWEKVDSFDKFCIDENSSSDQMLERESGKIEEVPSFEVLDLFGDNAERDNMEKAERLQKENQQFMYWFSVEDELEKNSKICSCDGQVVDIGLVFPENLEKEEYILARLVPKESSYTDVSFPFRKCNEITSCYSDINLVVRSLKGNAIVVFITSLRSGHAYNFVMKTWTNKVEQSVYFRFSFDPGGHEHSDKVVNEMVLANHKDFMKRVVVDVVTGGGFASLHAVEAGGRHFYAVGTSVKAEDVHRLVARNPALGEIIMVIIAEIEEIELLEKADVLAFDVMGSYVLSNIWPKEYVFLRNRFLNFTGKLFRSIKRLHKAPFTDVHLFNEFADEPVLKAYDPKVLVTPAKYHMITFKTIKEEDVSEIDIPLKFIASVAATIYGLACSFYVSFSGSDVPRWLTTSHDALRTDRQHIQCFLSMPIHVMSGQEITDRFQFVAHVADEYTIYLTMLAKHGGNLYTSSAKLELSNVYNRMYEDEHTDQLVITQDSPIQGHHEEGFDSLQRTVRKCRWKALIHCSWVGYSLYFFQVSVRFRDLISRPNNF